MSIEHELREAAKPINGWANPGRADLMLRAADELSRLMEVVKAADAIRAAQKAYMADRGNEAKGKAVGEAAAAYDRLRVLSEREGQEE